MQTEKKGLAKREKVMLFIMVVVGLFALMVMYVIIPLYNQLGDLQTEYSTLQAEKTRIDTMIAAENGIRDGRNQAVERHKTESIKYPDESHASEIGRMLTVLCETHGLIPVSQTLSDPKDFNVDGNAKPAAGDPEPVFVVMSAAMVLNGSYQNLMRLMDTVEEMDHIRISSFAYTWNVTATALNSDRIRIGFEVTMIKDVDFSKVEAEIQEAQNDDNWHGLDLG